MAKKRNPFSLSNLKNPAVIGGGSLLLALLGMLNRSSEVEPTGELDDISELIEGGNLAPGGDFPSEAPFQIQGEGEPSNFDMENYYKGNRYYPSTEINWNPKSKMSSFHEELTKVMPNKMGEGLSSDGVHDTLNNNIMLNELLIQMNK